ncbi:MAG TPA: DUF4440 domain-containing protein [Actinophytocola sp.]|uniref:DUF4440 domain-containing protein n=1 Tax=Actinophytocola sp. TaxID=1872138 RepID=UPI002DDD8772|nr:DUF4440 domain-containing protein [Actinophytocola sp.]HEV2778728.1 DUF4440 domain-containing protein [Actinophytocola sp.]
MRDEAGAVVEVEVDPATAFEVFTGETAAWWHRDLFRGPGELRFEPGAGGRLLLNGEREVGRVTVWEPTPRLVFSYGPAGAEVEVRFEATESGTRVVLRHRGWATDEEAGGQWAGVLAGFARHSLERALLRRLGEFLDAIGAGDVEFFERNLTEDALMIFPGRDNTYTKAEGIAAMSDHPPYVKYDIAEPRVVHLGDDTAVLTHRATVWHKEMTTPRHVRVSSVLVKVDGGWRLALHQWTE